MLDRFDATVPSQAVAHAELTADILQECWVIADVSPSVTDERDNIDVRFVALVLGIPQQVCRQVADDQDRQADSSRASRVRAEGDSRSTFTSRENRVSLSRALFKVVVNVLAASGDIGCGVRGTWKEHREGQE